MSDGHVPCHAVNWLKQQISSMRNDESINFLNHYPLDNGLDNWYEVIDLLKTKNTVQMLSGKKLVASTRDDKISPLTFD